MEQERDAAAEAGTKTFRPESKKGFSEKDQDGANQVTKDPCTDSEAFTAVLNFSTFILSLTTSMLVNLGELPDPVTNKRGVNLSLAKQTIGIIEILKEKTRGNLMDMVLFDLRMKYVSAAAGKQ
jgi:hypothetical protein